MQPPDRIPQPGEAVTLHVSRAYELVPIQGRVYLSTAFGVFFDRQNLRFLLPHSMLPLNRKFSRGEKVTLNITRSYARREGLTA